LRSRLQAVCQAAGLPLFVPEFVHAMDNAAMIAVAGYFRAMKGDFVDPVLLQADPNMDIV
ncbi:MAG TPA: tRNA (adenosine(37)-N6)-threonylcarbamoyltransferase complex transferase subunit TsaD, partial [bacterium]|nr:tRNA (adenosine(37)-N6)-threonylcarbamoyltransferase complex transferase subunit TsaD [bacterium]